MEVRLPVTSVGVEYRVHALIAEGREIGNG